MALCYVIMYCSLNLRPFPENLIHLNKTRGLRRWPTRETIVLRCNKLNPGSTEIVEIKVMNQIYLEQVYQHPRNVSIKNQKGILSRAGDIPKFVRFQ